MTSCAQAIKAWETKHEQKAEDAKEINITCQIPPLTKLDNSLSALKCCQKLSMSTNMIDRMAGLGGMSNLRILSMGRNNIKKIEKLDEVCGTLEQLWMSYNQISSLEGLSELNNLTTLFLSNNSIKSFSELDKIACLPNLKDVIFVGNPMYDDISRKEGRILILKHLPQVTKIDGDLVKPSERDEAASLPVE